MSHDSRVSSIVVYVHEGPFTGFKFLRMQAAALKIMWGPEARNLFFQGDYPAGD